MLSDIMKEILLYQLSLEHEWYPDEYPKSSIRALIRRGLLEGADDEYEITTKGIRALGLKSQYKAKRPKTIIKNVLKDLWGEEIPLLAPTALPAMAGDEDHNTGRVSWYEFDDALCAIEYERDTELYLCAQIACDYAQEQGHDLYIEQVRHFLIFYREEA